MLGIIKKVRNALRGVYQPTSVPQVDVARKSAILEAWSMVERLSEGSVNTKVKEILTFQNLQGDDWHALFNAVVQEKKLSKKGGIVVYIGIFPVSRLIDKLRLVYRLESVDEEIETGEKFTLALYFDRHLNLMDEKTFFTESGFILRNSGNIAEREEFREYDEREKRKLAERFDQTADNPDKFNAAFSAILHDMGADPENCRMQAVENIETGPVNLHSFFLSDLDKARKINTDNLNSYFNGGEEVYNLDSQRKSPNFNPKLFQKILKPENYPLGRYPSNTRYALSLMQQVAVNLSIGYDKQQMRSVNGPPGTGKTTLLKDIFAELAVRQVYEIAGIAGGEIKGEPENTYLENLSIGELPVQVAENNIIVASSNNTAVQNIVNEIPLITGIDKNLIGELKAADYFRDIANSAVKREKGEDGKNREVPDLEPEEEEKYWGLFSMEGGKSGNVTKILTKVEYVVKYLNEEYVSRPEVYRDFLQQYEKVKALRRMPSCPFTDWNLPYDELQKANPWFDEQFRIEQSRLFIAALTARKQFLYENRKNIAAAVHIMKKQDDHLERKHVIRIAFEWINFTVPVISSTFASFGQMYRNFAENSLGHLFIDEGGQALPQAGVGAIFRSKHVMVVGDPSQIKPVLTLDSQILGMLCKHYEINEKYLSASASVQTLTDSASRYGFYRESDMRSDSWIGIPLWVHRRCREPMFTISNRISYGGLMVQGNPGPGKTGWFNISGKAENKYVKEQGEFLARKIAALIKENPKISDEKEKDVIYVISPFANVAKRLADKLKTIGFTRYDNGKPVNVGTIHTFQGKEAPIVFLVLGADASTKGAAGWAVAEPNMINVAATRAVEEFYVIGDKQLYLGIGSDVASQTNATIEEYAKEHPDLIDQDVSSVIAKTVRSGKTEVATETSMVIPVSVINTASEFTAETKLTDSVACSSADIIADGDEEVMSWGKACRCFSGVPAEFKKTQTVNQLLRSKGYIAKDKNGWIVTEKGLEIGIVQSVYEGAPRCGYTEAVFKAVLKILMEE